VTGGEVIGDGPGAWLHGDLRERELSHFAQRESGDDAFESGEEPGEDTRGEEPSEKELRFLKQVNTRAALGADVRAAGMRHVAKPRVPAQPPHPQWSSVAECSSSRRIVACADVAFAKSQPHQKPLNHRSPRHHCSKEGYAPRRRG